MAPRQILTSNFSEADDVSFYVSRSDGHLKDFETIETPNAVNPRCVRLRLRTLTGA